MRKTAVAIVLAGLSIAVAAYLAIIVPERAASAYIKRVENAMPKLKPYVTRLSDSVFSDAFENTDLEKMTREQYLAEIIAEIESTRKMLAEFNRTTATFEDVSYGFLAPSHRKARVLNERAESFVLQSQARLDKYEEISRQSVWYIETVHELTHPIDAFNSVTDINIYAGRSVELRMVAASIRAQSAELAARELNPELREVQRTSVAAYERVAVGFDELAFAIENPVDDVIYSVVRKIETDAIDAAQVSQVEYLRQLQSSRAVRDILELEQALEAVSV